ncbi:MAG TPA: hypothetical protein ENI05_10430 [Porticoccus sp.]|nr:hypothetical protein [Porticoccus sp.]
MSPVADVHRIGESLEAIHRVKLGKTQMIVSIWDKGSGTPKVFSLTPGNEYDPKHMAGVIGIGPRDVVDNFKLLANNPPKAVEKYIESINLLKEIGCTGQDLESRIQALSQSLYQSVLTEIGGDFREAITSSNIPCVGLPVQVQYMDVAGVQQVGMYVVGGDSTTFNQITASEGDLRLPRQKAGRVPYEDDEPYPAIQIFK